ncbi:hypothetical protein ACRAWF_44225 [Streptomyces sp. L7]
MPLDGGLLPWSPSTYAVVDSSTRPCGRWWPVAYGNKTAFEDTLGRGAHQGTPGRRLRPRHRIHRAPPLHRRLQQSDGPGGP